MLTHGPRQPQSWLSFDVRQKQTMPSYSTRTVVRFVGLAAKAKYVYEERITLWRAKSVDGAIRKSEAEAKRYAKESGGTYLKFIQAYWLYDDVDSDGLEVFSLMRESDLSSNQYIDTHFDTGTEKQKK
jgi:hypothetical protein